MALYRHGPGSLPWLEAGVGDGWLEGIGQGCGQGCDKVAMFWSGMLKVHAALGSPDYKSGKRLS